MASTRDVLDLLDELAQLTTLKEQSPQSFKVRAYENAKQGIQADGRDVTQLSAAELTKIKGIGKSTASKIREFMDTGEVETRIYSWEVENHHPIDLHVEDGYLYACFAIPGSVCKIDLETGRIVARFTARPGWFTRYASMALDIPYLLIDYGTMRNRHDTAEITLPLISHAFFLGRTAGTRAGFFAMGAREESDEIYICHRGLNTIYCLRKHDLGLRWSEPLPSRGRHDHCATRRERDCAAIVDHESAFARQHVVDDRSVGAPEV